MQSVVKYLHIASLEFCYCIFIFCRETAMMINDEMLIILIHSM